jgi:hypothetical protein
MELHVRRAIGKVGDRDLHLPQSKLGEKYITEAAIEISRRIACSLIKGS